MVVIKVEDLSKEYIISHQQQERYTALRDVMTNRAKDLVHKIMYPSRRNNVSTTQYEDFWALKDVSFNVNHGDRVGIIGRNGAGKSTLLKVLSRITEPTKGRVSIKGKVASLLEVGTGFHPELTGRENIFLNGAILGMSRASVKEKFDEIVSFADVERFLDTPVKRYSSGMYMRLAFAVAAHLEPDILIVDEVLAVGDSEFQKKCLGKMNEVAREGRTVLFVSHNMGAIKNLCNVGVLLNAGRVEYQGSIKNAVDQYLKNSVENQSDFSIPKPLDPNIPGYVENISIEDEYGNPATLLPIGKPWQIKIRFKILRPISQFVVGIGFMTIDNMPFRTVWAPPENIQPGDYEVLFREDYLVMGSGRYNVIIGLSSREITIQSVSNAAFIEFDEYASKEIAIKSQGVGLILNKMNTTISRLN